MEKVLWLVNSELPQIGRARGRNGSSACGWVSSAYDYINDVFDLTVVYPVMNASEERVCLEGGNKYCSYFNTGKEKVEIEVFERILETVKPDIVDIWGSEFPRSWHMVKACINKGLKEKVILSMQGSSSEIALHYISNLRGIILYKMSFRDFLRRDSIIIQRKRYQRNGFNEEKLIKSIHYCIGKTDWDHSVAKRCNPKIKYFRCTENLREIFYKNIGGWKPENAEPHKIVVAQGNYPLKGLHNILKAVFLLKDKYPDISLTVCGTSPLPKNRLKITSYGLYLDKLIKKYGLDANVNFVGMKTEEEICEIFMSSRVLVSASSIENESNSISEARMIGLPVVASAVGGVLERIQHGVDGFLFSYDDTHMMAYYIDMLFSDTKLCVKISKEGLKCSEVYNDVAINNRIRQEVYKEAIERSHQNER